LLARHVFRGLTLLKKMKRALELELIAVAEVGGREALRRDLDVLRSRTCTRSERKRR